MVGPSIVFVGDVHYITLFWLDYHLPFLSLLVESAEVITQSHVDGVVPVPSLINTIISKGHSLEEVPCWMSFM